MSIVIPKSYESIKKNHYNQKQTSTDKRKILPINIMRTTQLISIQLKVHLHLLISFS